MSQFTLNQETRDVLDRVRHSRKTLSVFDMPADLAEAAVWEVGKLILDHQSLPLMQSNICRWYLREVAKLLRTKSGWDLALELDICMRKWAAYQVDPVLLQALLCECCNRIGAMTPEEIEENPKSETRMTSQGGRPETRVPRPESTTKTQRHEEERAEVRPKNDERRTRNEVTTAGGAHG